MPVARQAPMIPMLGTGPYPKIKIGSRIRLIRFPSRVSQVMIDVLPCPMKNPFNPPSKHIKGLIAMVRR
ncbi:unknown protein [Waddlia chondrophila 2032/99]|uniref:Uncharacterized protein n=1 Tax=Waddlia chondrophila 2032/99 TaxID=765953 RepID=F8LBZ2_9BACT|nr:unknown protein [Waddlia chondrophila 2032/99]